MTTASTGRAPRSLWVEAGLALVLLVTIVPIAWTVMLGFLPNRAIVSRSWTFPFWFGNYRDVFGDGTFTIQLVNSVLIVLGSIALSLVIGSLAGYALSKLSPPRWVVYPALVCAAFIPLIPPATLVPGLYILLNNLGLLGTIPGLIMINTFFNLPFAMLLMSSYFSALPNELRESARVDGASELRTFLLIMLPIVKPGLSAVGIFVGIMTWNEFLMGLTLTSGGATAPVTVGIASLVQSYSVTWGQLAAAGTVAAIPIIAMAVFANRLIVAGLTAGAVKG